MVRVRVKNFQSIKDAPKRKCPHCGKSALERLIGTGGAIIFKGSGFYQTDYRSESYKKAAEADKPLEPKAPEKPETKAADTASTAEPKPSAKPADTTPKAKSTKGKKPRSRA